MALSTDERGCADSMVASNTDNRRNVPIISFLIHSDSLCEAIEDPNSPLAVLLGLEPVASLYMAFTPPSRRSTLERLKSKGANVVTIEDDVQTQTIRTRHFETTVRRGLSERLSRPIAEGSPVTVFDYSVVAKGFDYLVVSERDPIWDHQPAGVRLASPEEALSAIRVILVHSGVFILSENRQASSEGLYYLCRSKKLFPEAWSAWSVAVHHVGRSVPTQVYEQLHSLHKRLEFICKASDTVSFYALSTPDNESEFNILYHLAYLVVLVTGIFDDLAWLVTRRHSLQLNRMEVSLRIPEKKTETEFYKQLGRVNPRLHDYLTDRRTQATLSLFYPIRDAIQHRVFIGSLLCVGGTGRGSSIHIESPEASTNLALSLSQDGTGTEWGVFQSGETRRLEPYVFAHMAVSSVAAIMNQVLRLLDFGQSLPGPPSRRTIWSPTAHPYL